MTKEQIKEIVDLVGYLNYWEMEQFNDGNFILSLDKSDFKFFKKSKASNHEYTNRIVVIRNNFTDFKKAIEEYVNEN